MLQKLRLISIDDFSRCFWRTPGHGTGESLMAGLNSRIQVEGRCFDRLLLPDSFEICHVSAFGLKLPFPPRREQ
jgi:hypothetical protein